MKEVFTKQECFDLMASAAELAVTKALGKVGVIKPYLTRQEANRIYGRSNVDRWITSQVITKRQKGMNKQWRLDRAELETIAATEIKVGRK